MALIHCACLKLSYQQTFYQILKIYLKLEGFSKHDWVSAQLWLTANRHLTVVMQINRCKWNGEFSRLYLPFNTTAFRSKCGNLKRLGSPFLAGTKFVADSIWVSMKIFPSTSQSIDTSVAYENTLCSVTCFTLKESESLFPILVCRWFSAWIIAWKASHITSSALSLSSFLLLYLILVALEWNWICFAFFCFPTLMWMM